MHTAHVVAFILYACAAIVAAVAPDRLNWAVCLVAAGLAVDLTPTVF